MDGRLTLFTFASPPRFYWLTGKLIPWLWAACIALTVAGVVLNRVGSTTHEKMLRDALAPFEGPVAIDLMRRLKAALDPDDRLNPGKLLPPV